MTIVDPFVFRVTAKFDSPLYGGGGVTADVPGLWPVALDGRGYMLDTQVEHTFTDYWDHESITLLRAQADTGSNPAEASLNPEGLWRRAAESWHHGAGQLYRDRDNAADQYRFHTSIGVNPWVRYNLSLLPDTTQVLASVASNLLLVSAGSRLYHVDGVNLKYTTDLIAYTTCTGYAGGQILSACSDGFTVYATNGTSVFTTDTTTDAVASYNTLDCELLAYVKGRLMAANGPALYNITSGTPPTALFTHANADFTWVGFAEGQAALYAAGYSGDKSLIYRIAVKPDASTLDQPIIAGELPDGEIIRSIGGYLGYIVLGTDNGWRFAVVDAQGNLNIGSRIAMTSPVLAFEPNDRFIWFGWTNIDADHSGIGRMDITQFTDVTATQALTPAYASDLMAPSQGTVPTIASFLDKRVFAVIGVDGTAGFYAEADTLVASGTVTTGLISYGIPDKKTALYVDVRTAPLSGSYTVALAVDNGSYVTLQSETDVSGTGAQFNANQTRGDHFELQFVLTASEDLSAGPILERWTLKAFPTTNDGSAETLRIPLLLARVVTVGASQQTVDVPFEREIIKALRATRKIVTYQEIDATYVGFVNDYHWVPHNLANQDGKWVVDGTMIVSFKRV